MADQMKPTPRNTVLGLFSDFVNLPLQYMSQPERTQQSQGVAQFLYGTGIPKTLERMSYGESLFSGAGGLGGTTRMRPETADALVNVAPFAPAAGRLTTRAVRATEGLPVGLGIKDVGGKFNIASRDASDIFGAGSTRIRYTEPNSGGSIEVLTKPDGSASILSLEVPKKFRGKRIGESLQAQAMQDFPVLQGQVSSKAAATTAYRLGRRPPNQPNASLEDVFKIIDENSSVNMVSPAMQKQVFMPSFTYPQQAALDLAQQRAALPIEQGGLGLPANNTAMDRARHPLMQFTNERYHETEAKNIPTIANYDVRRPVAGASDEQTPYGMFVKPSGAKIGVAKEGETQMPLLVKSNLTDQNVMRSFMDREDLQSYLNQFPDLKKATSDVRNLDNQMADYIAKESERAFALQDQGKTEDADKILAMFNPNSNVMQEFNKQMAEKTAIAKDLITKHFQDKKFGSVGLVNDQGAFGKKAITEIVLNPENVRSRFAAFDPFRKDVATATAMGVALPDLLAQPVRQYELPQETTPMYTDPFGNTIGSSIR